MRKCVHFNRIRITWLLTVAFALMALPSGASWQCLDGHACPPDCTMQQARTTKRSSASHACCLPQKERGTGSTHCALCSEARPEYAKVKERCTSSVCVLRIQAKPDVVTPAYSHFLFDFETSVPFLPFSSVDVCLEERTILSFSESRAPPGSLSLCLFSPRAPPFFL